MVPLAVALIWTIRRQHWPIAEILGLPYLLLRDSDFSDILSCPRHACPHLSSPEVQAPDLLPNMALHSLRSKFCQKTFFFILVSATLVFTIVTRAKIHMHWVNLRKIISCCCFQEQMFFLSVLPTAEEFNYKVVSIHIIFNSWRHD